MSRSRVCQNKHEKVKRIERRNSSKEDRLSNNSHSFTQSIPKAEREKLARKVRYAKEKGRI